MYARIHKKLKQTKYNCEYLKNMRTFEKKNQKRNETAKVISHLSLFS